LTYRGPLPGAGSPFRAMLAGAALGLVLAWASTGPAGAQDTQGASDEEVAIEEIVVTSQRRAERLQDVPITVDAFDYEELEKQDPVNLFEVANFTAGLQIKSSYFGRNPVIYMRGVGINDVNQNFQGPVAIYFDDIFMASTITQVSQMFDFERVEVLKGPQGTLFGRNTTGGLVSLVPRLPDGRYEGYAQVTIGDIKNSKNLDIFNVDAAFSVPIVEDKLSARFAVRVKNRDGFQFNIFDQRDDGRIDDVAGRAILRYQPDETLDTYVTLFYRRGRSDESQKKPQGLFNRSDFDENGVPVNFDEDGNPINTFCPNPTLGGPNACADVLGYVDTNGPRTINSNIDTIQDINVWGANLHVTKTGIEAFGSEIGVKSITGYNYHKHIGLEDVNTDPNDVLNINWYSKFNQISQELQVFSDGAGPLTWILGGHFQFEDLDVANIFDFFFLTEDFGGPGVFLDQTYKQKVTSLAGFFDTTYAITDQWRVTAGVRLTYEKRTFDRASLAVDPSLPLDVNRQALTDPSLVIFPFVTRAKERISTTRPTWRFVTDYRPTEDVMLYVSVSKGFKSGGFSGGGLFDASEFSPFGPETLIAYEGGIKSNWANNRVRLNASTYYYDYNNLQVFAFFNNPETNTIGNFTQNASNAEIYGVDIDFTAVPVTGLTVHFGSTWLPTAKFVNFLTLDAQGNPVDLSGNRLQSAPKLNFNWFVEYGVPVGNDSIVVFRLDGYHNSKMFFENENRDRVSTKNPYNVLNARITFQYGERWTMSVWVKNLNDKLVLEDVLPLEVIGIDQVTTNVQRRWGLDLSARF